MKTNFFYLAVVIATTSLFCYSESAGAQAIIVEEDVSVTEVVPTKPRYYSDSHKNNWFISIGAGGQTFLTEHVGDAQYTLAMDFAIGKWISPYLGFRLSAMGGALHTNWPLAEGVMTHMRYAAVYGDIMWNMFNTFHGYNEDRVFSIIPFAGAGGIYSFHNTPYNNKTYAFPITAGIKLNFRLSHYVDFFLEGRGNLIGDHFNGIVEGTEVESVISAIGGFSIKFGKDRFKAYDAYADQMVIGDLNNRVNALRAQLNECESRVVECPPCPEAVVEEVTVIEPAACSQELTGVVRFTINSAVVSNEEMVNVYNIAQWMKSNPSCNISVIGYADKATGTPEYNKQLSQRRAESVVKLLTEKYNIDRKRIQIIANGSDSQLYPKNNNWNRIVVFSGSAQ